MKRKLLFIPALAVGVAIFVLLSRTSKGPQLAERDELARKVRVLTVPRLDLVPRAIGYGEARPGRVWQAVPEVGGRIIEKAPRLKEGNILKEDTVLIRIDPSDYDLEVAQAESQIQSIRAQLAQLATKEKTVRASLEIEERSLGLAESELKRVRALVDRESLTPADLDREERNFLTQRIRVQELHNTLDMIEPDRKVLQAQEALERSRLAKSRLNVERTVIRAPFDCRIGAVDVEQDQVVQPGQVLFSADGIDTSEVTAQIPLVGVGHVLTVGSAPIDVAEAPIEALLRLGLTATVRLTAGSINHVWEAEVTRVRGIDSQTRTLGIVVTVKDPYKNIRIGVEPPLVRGMYVEVEVRGPPRPGSVVVPRATLQGGRVFLVDEESRLEPREVTVAHVQSSFAVISAGLEGGERIILSDLVPAVPGMLLETEDDRAAAEALAADATGRTRMR